MPTRFMPTSKLEASRGRPGTISAAVLSGYLQIYQLVVTFYCLPEEPFDARGTGFRGEGSSRTEVSILRQSHYSAMIYTFQTRAMWTLKVLAQGGCTQSPHVLD